MKNKIINYLSKIVLIILWIASFLFMYNTYKLNILNNTYLLLIFIIILILLGIITFKLIRKKTRNFSKIIFTIISLFLIILYSLGTSYINNTRNFLTNITTKDNLEYKTYNVLILKDIYSKIKELENKNIGFLTENYENSAKELKKKSKISFNKNNFDNAIYLSESLYNKESDAISIEESYLDILKETKENYMNDKKIIYTYKVAIKNDQKVEKININKPFILYISGSDARGNVKDVARSDVNIIAVVRPEEHKILLVSTPRDYYVQLHGTTGDKDKLTHAGVYGINKSITTMQDLLDIKIDRYIKVSFETVIKGVDVIGGIDIYSDKAFIPWTDKACPIKVGTQHLNGKCALAFARERHAYASGDRHRGENQEQVLSKMIEKISTPKYITKYNDILNAIDGSFETNASYEEITALIKKQIDNPISWSIETYNLDGASSMGPTYTRVNEANWIHIMIPYENTIETAKTKINEYLK